MSDEAGDIASLAFTASSFSMSSRISSLSTYLCRKLSPSFLAFSCLAATALRTLEMSPSNLCRAPFSFAISLRSMSFSACKAAASKLWLPSSCLSLDSSSKERKPMECCEASFTVCRNELVWDCLAWKDASSSAASPLSFSASAADSNSLFSICLTCSNSSAISSSASTSASEPGSMKAPMPKSCSSCSVEPRLAGTLVLLLLSPAAASAGRSVSRNSSSEMGCASSSLVSHSGSWTGGNEEATVRPAVVDASDASTWL
mmetsp:Transcript_11939/g.27889  ORF Transcript_11939/g.27889 Transcript_11939/m.27889 type:complete len:259 (+) Transcript_11939:370-1146(+)